MHRCRCRQPVQHHRRPLRVGRLLQSALQARLVCTPAPAQPTSTLRPLHLLCTHLLCVSQQDCRVSLHLLVAPLLRVSCRLRWHPRQVPTRLQGTPLAAAIFLAVPFSSRFGTMLMLSLLLLVSCTFRLTEHLADSTDSARTECASRTGKSSVLLPSRTSKSPCARRT